MKKLLLGLAVVGLVCLTATTLYAANRVTVESKTIGVNSPQCPVHVLLDNDVALYAIVVPLVVREVTPGSFVTDMKLSWADRLTDNVLLHDLRVTHRLPDPDGTCRPGGFFTVGSDDTLSHPVASSPEGVLFVGLDIFGSADLPPGSDAYGSLVMTLSVTGTPGTFEIDSTCIDPSNYLTFAERGGPQFIPAFTKGIVTIVDNQPPVAQCANVQVSAVGGCEASASIDNGSFDPDGDAITLTQVPPGPYPLGANIVRLYVEDEHCAIDSCEAVVTVVDDTPPVIVCHPDTIVIIDHGDPGAILEFESSAMDECGDVTIECNPPSGSFFSIGVTTVTCTATDGFGNSAQCTFNAAVLPPGGYCNHKGEDINCDGAMDAVDLNHLIRVLYFNAPLNGACCFTEEAPE